MYGHSSSVLGDSRKKYADVVDPAIAKLLQEEENSCDLTKSDELIARELQEMENKFINSIPDERSHHFNIPTEVIPVQTGPLSRGSPNWNSSYEENESDDFHTDHETNGVCWLGGHDDDHADPENMSYEELQELAEDIGSESKGLSETTIASLHESTYKGSKLRSSTSFFKSKSKNPSNDNCAICQSAIRKGEKIITLPCKHYFHTECITPWLKMNKVCPNCKYEIEDKS